MEFINFITISIIPLIVLLIVVAGVKEKKNVFDLFNLGVIDGLKLMFKLFPTLLRAFFCY